MKLTPEWVGTSADADIPIPPNVRRYYIPGTTHGGLNVPAPNTQFNASLAGSLLPPPACPGNNFGTGLLNANPLPHLHTVNALRLHFRNWVMKGVEPPPNRYPTIAAKTLVNASKEAIGFPSLPGLPASVPTVVPPKIKRIIPMLAPKVDADGNELGGVPLVLNDAPLGTYLGWNITAGGGEQCVGAVKTVN